MKNLKLTLPTLPYSVEEALKKLRINIKFSGNDTKRILITSSIPNEGKSFTSVQLWRLLAEAGSKVVFVDLDLRNSVLKQRLAMESDAAEITGLDYYLSGQCEYEDVVYSTNIENGDFVPCTNLLENPSSLFEDKRFEEFLDRLDEDYRYIILDSAPIANASDANQIATLCDGAVLIVRSGFTPRKLIRKSMQQLEYVQCKLLGVVLNREQMSAKSYGKYGKYGEYYGGYGSYGPED